MRRRLFIALFILILPGVVLAQRVGGQKPVLGTQIIKHHPLAQGLLLYWPIVEGAGTVYDYSGNGRIGTLVSGAFWSNGGIEFPQSAANGVEWIDDVDLDGTKITALTLFVDFTREDSTDTFGYLIGKNFASYNLYIDESGAGEGTIGMGVTSDIGFSEYFSTKVVAVGERGFMIGTWSATSNTINVYWNGILVATGGRTGSNIAADVFLFTMGKRGAAEIRDFKGTIYSGGMYNRALTDGEIRWLSQDPYAMFARPSTARKFLGPAAPAGGGGKPVPPKLIIIGKQDAKGKDRIKWVD